MNEVVALVEGILLDTPEPGLRIFLTLFLVASVFLIKDEFLLLKRLFHVQDNRLNVSCADEGFDCKLL